MKDMDKAGRGTTSDTRGTKAAVAAFLRSGRLRKGDRIPCAAFGARAGVWRRYNHMVTRKEEV
jgi:hypothetical protein